MYDICVLEGAVQPGLQLNSQQQEYFTAELR